MPNPFVYGEVVPAAAFVNREIELERLTQDLLAGQKIFLISPRRYLNDTEDLDPTIRAAIFGRNAAATLGIDGAPARPAPEGATR